METGKPGKNESGHGKVMEHAKLKVMESFQLCPQIVPNL